MGQVLLLVFTTFQVIFRIFLFFSKISVIMNWIYYFVSSLKIDGLVIMDFVKYDDEVVINWELRT